MNERCSGCGRKFDRAPGYLLGSIYVNYGLTALLVVVAYFGFFFAGTFTSGQLLAILAAFGVLFPLWFFRYSRALWMAFDEKWDPWPNEEEARERMRIQESGVRGPESSPPESTSAAER